MRGGRLDTVNTAYLFTRATAGAIQPLVLVAGPLDVDDVILDQCVHEHCVLPSTHFLQQLLPVRVARPVKRVRLAWKYSRCTFERGVIAGSLLLLAQQPHVELVDDPHGTADLESSAGRPPQHVRCCRHLWRCACLPQCRCHGPTIMPARSGGHYQSHPASTSRSKSAAASVCCADA